MIAAGNIQLSLDMGSFELFDGNPSSIDLDASNDYITTFIYVLPPAKVPYWTERVEVTLQEHHANVRNFVVEKEEDDILFRIGTQLQFGVNVAGLPSLPFKYFTDNRGRYPCWCTEISIPTKVALWKSLPPKTGDMDMLGPPPDTDKILALRLWNAAVQNSGLRGQIRKIDYEDVTTLGQFYFDKKNRAQKLARFLALSTRTAYRAAVREFFLQRQLIDIIGSYEKELSQRREVVIETEMDLLNFIKGVIEQVFKHHIENRRWIQPFWDGTRQVLVDGARVEVPATPKREKDIQPTIHVLLHELMRPQGIHVVRESDEGIGLLDFRCLHTTRKGEPLSVSIEFKVGHHKRLKHGVTSQLPAYIKANRGTTGIFLVLWFKDSEGKYFREPMPFNKEDTEKLIREWAGLASQRHGFTIEGFLIDASIKPSASL